MVYANSVKKHQTIARNVLFQHIYKKISVYLNAQRATICRQSKENVDFAKNFAQNAPKSINVQFVRMDIFC